MTGGGGYRASRDTKNEVRKEYLTGGGATLKIEDSGLRTVPKTMKDTLDLGGRFGQT